MFCLQNRPSFGKIQLLKAPFLANQNKNKRRQNSNLISYSNALFDILDCKIAIVSSI